MDTPQVIKISAMVNAPIDVVWESWTNPVHIVKWNQASDDWHSPHATTDLKAGGRFVIGMAAKDGSAAFDFAGTYTRVVPQKAIEYTLDDMRTVIVRFEEKPDGVLVEEQFDAESMHPVDFQQAGWQSILNSFKTYTESLS